MHRIGLLFFFLRKAYRHTNKSKGFSSLCLHFVEVQRYNMWQIENSLVLAHRLATNLRHPTNQEKETQMFFGFDVKRRTKHKPFFFCAGTRLFLYCFLFFTLFFHLSSIFIQRVKCVWKRNKIKRGYPTVRHLVCYVNEKTVYWKENSHPLERTLTLATCCTFSRWTLFLSYSMTRPYQIIPKWWGGEFITMCLMYIFHNFIEQISDYTEMVSQEVRPVFVLFWHFFFGMYVYYFRCVNRRLECFKNITTTSIIHILKRFF